MRRKHDRTPGISSGTALLLLMCGVARIFGSAGIGGSLENVPVDGRLRPTYDVILYTQRTATA